MRVSVLLIVTLVLTACSADPRSFGITGPGSSPAPSGQSEASGMDSTPQPGAPTTGTFYGPTTGPVTGASGFWGYNN